MMPEFFEKDYSVWIDGFEQELKSTSIWNELLCYKRISLFDSTFNAIYRELLSGFRGYFDKENVFSNNVNDYKNQGTTFAKMLHSVNHFKTKLNNYLPPKEYNYDNPGKTAFVIRGAKNETGYPVIKSLKDDFGWNVIFGSWNLRLKKTVKNMGLDYIYIKNIYRNKWKELLNIHTIRITKIIDCLDCTVFARSFSKYSNCNIKYDARNLIVKYFVHASALIDLYNDLFGRINPEILILFNENTLADRTAALVARRLGIPSVFIQHGILMGYVYRNMVTDYAIVWGDIPKNFLMERCCSSNKIFTAGPYGFEKLFSKQKLIIRSKNHNKNQKTVLFIGQNPFFFLTLRTYKKTIRAIINTAELIPEINFIVKPHPGQNRKQYLSVIKETKLKNIQFVDQVPIEDLIVNADLVITVFSTSGLEAMTLGRPVIVLDLSREPPLAPYVSASYYVNSEEKLLKGIRRILNNEKLNSSLVKLGFKYSEEYFGNYNNNPSFSAAQYIELINFNS